MTGHAAAIEPADLVINAIAGSQAPDALTAIGADVLAGKVLLDLGDAVTPAFELVCPNVASGEAPGGPSGHSGGQGPEHPRRSAHGPARPGPSSTVFLSGDDDASKDVVRGGSRTSGGARSR